MAVLTHVLALFTWIIGPIVVLVASEDDFAKNNARTALNWQITMTIYGLVSLVLMLLLIGFVLLWALGIMNLIFCIMAAVKAADGKIWEYPVTISFLKQQ